MFARKKRNKTGSVSIQLIDKKDGCFRVVQTLGCSKDPDEIEKIWQHSQQILHSENPLQTKLFATEPAEDLIVKNTVEQFSNQQICTIGPELIFGTLFDRLGFNSIPDKLFRHIVIARLAYPGSKLKTVDYLYRYQGISVTADSIYRFLDTLNDKYKETAEQISYAHTKKVVGKISVVFYDMTTLYFETEDEDDLRKIGFSKDGKFQNPQIMLGLLVGKEGYPIGYDIFPGNTVESHTLIPILQNIQKKYGFKKPVVIADAGLLSKNNIEELIRKKYKFIIGARIKNETVAIQEKIFQEAENIKDGQTFILKKSNGTRLVVSYTSSRARKDAFNRERGLKKLREKVKTGKLTKNSINNRGYNKFLVLEGKVKVSIDEDKLEAEKKWDGLKGYITNSRLSADKIIKNYRELWQIEKAFRISKTDLTVRPIHHFKEKRIRAHICIAFVAYSIYKELERQLKKKKVDISPKRAAELTHTMYQLQFTLPISKQVHTITLKMDLDQQQIYNAVF